MKKSILLVVIAIVIVAAIILIGYVYKNRSAEKINSFAECQAAGGAIMETYPEQCAINGQTFTQEISNEGRKMLNSPKTGSNRESIDDTWELYTNYDLGFSLKVLKETKSYGQLEIIEKGNVVYLITNKGTPYQNILANINGSISDIEKVSGIPWAILVKKVNNEEELEKFLQEKYGEGCQVGEKKDTVQSGVFEVQIKGDGKDLGSTKCPVNFRTSVKYYPTKQLVASWDIGQDYNFTVGDNPVDQEMIDSFRFIE